MVYCLLGQIVSMERLTVTVETSPVSDAVMALFKLPIAFCLNRMGNNINIGPNIW